LETAAAFARAGNKLINFIVSMLIIVMLLYGGYSIWDTQMMYSGAFISKDLLEFKPSSSGEMSDGRENLSLADLQKINEDVRGWITIDDTHIDYPVVQGEDDMEYVNLNVYGEFELSGSIFLAVKNSPDFSDAYNLFYGHHMANGGMFGDVVAFVKKDYFDSHRTGTLYTMETSYPLELFACMQTDAYDSMIFYPEHRQGDAYPEFLTYIRNASTHYREIGLSDTDRIVALSTCADGATNGRVILFGRIVE